MSLYNIRIKKFDSSSCAPRLGRKFTIMPSVSESMTAIITTYYNSNLDR